MPAQFEIIPPNLAINGNFRVGEGDAWRQWFTGAGPRRVMMMTHLAVKNVGDAPAALDMKGKMAGGQVNGGYLPDVLGIELWDANTAGSIIDGKKPWPASQNTFEPGETRQLPTWYPAYLLDITNIYADGRYTLRFWFNPGIEGVKMVEAFYPIVILQTDCPYVAIEPQILPPRVPAVDTVPPPPPAGIIDIE